MIGMTLHPRTFELREPFTITRFTWTHIRPLWVELRDGAYRGRGEAMGIDYHGETVDHLVAQLEAVRPAIESGITRAALTDLLPPGAARNAVDNALWDLDCKRAGQRIWQLLDSAAPLDLETQYTISLGDPEAMADQARRKALYPLLKIKLGRGDADMTRLAAVRQARPDARLMVDANQGWSAAQLRDFAPDCARLGVELIEQPLPIGEDAWLADWTSPVPLCADESVDDSASLTSLPAGYRFINIKLDKTGGLSEALRLADAATARGLGLMVGCMLGTSLGMAPAAVVGARCTYIDLDGPLDLMEDAPDPIVYDGARMAPFSAALWG